MTKILYLLTVSMALAVMSHLCSPRSIRTGEYIRKEHFFWCLLALFMIGFAGLRIHYNDTDTYVYAFNALLEQGADFRSINWILGDNPGFNLVNYILVSLHFSAQSFLMFYSILTVGIYLWFLRKYSTNLWLTIFLFVVVGNYIFTLAAIKQCVAIAFSLVGTDRFLHGKTLALLFWVILGSLFHPYALMYLLVPFLTFRPWTTKTYLLLFVFFAAGLLLQPLMGTVIDITTMMGEEYDASTFMGEGVNPFRLAVILVPTLLSLVTQKVIEAEDNWSQNLIINLATLNGAIMFVALFGTANYFARLANYFVIFQSLALPRLFAHFEKRSRLFITATAVGCYLLYFYYENGIILPFDYFYYSTTLRAYLLSLF